MSAKVKIKMPSFDQMMAFLQPKVLGPAMKGTASYISAKIKMQWQSGQGADGKPFTGGNGTYLKRKAKSGRDGKIDLNVGGGLSRSFYPRQFAQDGSSVTLAFGGMSKNIELPVLTEHRKKDRKPVPGEKDNLKVARGLVGKRPGILSPSERLVQLANAHLQVQIRNFVKMTK